MVAGTVEGAGSGGAWASAPRFVVPGAASWTLRDRVLSLDRPRVMGIVNLTPDSFSDGGALPSLDDAMRHAESLVGAGADLLDVGGESTRPGATPVGEAEEVRRVLPFVRAAVNRFDVPVSVDTRKAGVARAALDAGAHVVNDVSGLAHDPALGEVVAHAGAGLVLMHMRGEPATMTGLARYRDVVGEVRAELGEALARARRAGVEDARVVLDPGLGFAKDAAHNWALLRGLDGLGVLGRPLLVGPSRKRFLGELLDVEPRERATGTAAACLLAYLAGARLFRVHDVLPVVQALRVVQAVADGGASREPVKEG